jgi:hypothetical protein
VEAVALLLVVLLLASVRVSAAKPPNSANAAHPANNKLFIATIVVKNRFN